MHEFKSRMLRMIAQQPRNLHDFTEASLHTVTVCSGTVERYVADLIADGLIAERDGTYHATDEGIAQATRPPTIAQSRVWGPASTVGTDYVPPKVYVRSGGEDFLRIQSRGMG